jgi:hypothetical protein
VTYEKINGIAFKPQVVVASRQLGDAQHAAVNRQSGETIDDERIGPQFQQ